MSKTALIRVTVPDAEDPEALVFAALSYTTAAVYNVFHARNILDEDIDPDHDIIIELEEGLPGLVEDLDQWEALPIGTVAEDNDGDVWRRGGPTGTEVQLVRNGPWIPQPRAEKMFNYAPIRVINWAD